MQGTELIAVLNPDRAPYSWRNNGVWKGILYDAIQTIIKKSGLRVTLYPVKDRAEYEDLISRGAVDIRFDSEAQSNKAEKDGYWLTSPYVTVPVSRLYRKNITVFKRAAIPYNKDMFNEYGQKLHNQGMTVTYYDSIDKIVEAIQSGKEDVAYMAMDTAIMAVRNDPTNKLVMGEVLGDRISYAAAVNEKQNPLLYAVISKVISSFDKHEMDLIRQGYLDESEKPFSMIGYVYDYPLQVFVFAILLVGIFVFYQRRKAESLRLRKEQAQNELLRDALAAAEKAGVAKSRFLSRVSHEMRTPLNAILGFMELSKGTDKATMERNRDSSEIAAKQLLCVINDVLDMSSIESGKLKISKTTFNLHKLLASLNTIYKSQCKHKGIDFEIKTNDPIEEWLIGDELRLNQILMNLLGNAVKFTKEGFVCMTLTQTIINGDKIFIEMKIADTGCGMSEELKERLFKPFEQESSAIARQYGGSGLGLSIVKNLVGMMDGSVRVYSVQNEGTVVVVDLPFERGCAVLQAEEEQKP